MTKGAVATDNFKATFSPATVGPVSFNAPGTAGARWSGTINSQGLATNPIHSNISGLDAGDRVTFAMVVENRGTSSKGVFDIVISDTLPSIYAVPPGGLNLRIAYGDNSSSPLGYTKPNGSPAVGTDLFAGGIKIDDPGAPGVGAGQAYTLTSGLNVIVITYDLQLKSSVTSNTSATNQGVLSNYSGTEGGPDYTNPTDLTSSSVSTTQAPSIGKALAGTNQAHTTGTNVAIGEIITYSLTISIPEGVTTNVLVTDTLNAGLAFVDCNGISASAAVTSTIGAFTNACNDPTNPTQSGNGQTIVYNLGNLWNSDTNNAITETVNITYTAVVLNTSANTRGQTRANSATMTYGNGALGSVVAPSVTIVEPQLSVTKSMTPITGDAGDVVTFTLRITNTAPGNTDAFNVVLTDTVPLSMTYVTGSFANTAGLAPTTMITATPVLSATWDSLAVGQSSTVQFRATFDGNVNPRGIITNTGYITGSSLPGIVTTPQSPYNTASIERSGNAGDIGGSAANPYRSNASASATVNSPTIGKAILGTNQTHTAGTNVAIGEIITYSLTITVPEGITPNAVVTDTLPANGLAFGQCLGVTASAALSSSIGAWANACNAGTTPGVSNPLITSSGQIAAWSLGTVTNSDTNNAAAETISISYTAVVLNTAGNTRGTTRANSAALTFTGGSLTAVAAPNVTIVEPSLLVRKTANPTTGDAGDIITFTLTVSNTSPANTDAFDVGTHRHHTGEHDLCGKFAHTYGWRRADDAERRERTAVDRDVEHVHPIGYQHTAIPCDA